MIDSYIRAGKIVSKIRSDASEMIKEGCLVLDLVEYVEGEILKQDAGIAFPCNVSINEVAAHYTSPINDKTVIHAGDMVKLDLGAEVDGCIADSAVTILAGGNIDENYTQDEINLHEEIVEASEAGLEAAIATALVSEPPLPRVVILSYLLTPWKPATITIFFLSSSFLILSESTVLILAMP